MTDVPTAAATPDARVLLDLPQHEQVVLDLDDALALLDELADACDTAMDITEHGADEEPDRDVMPTYAVYGINPTREDALGLAPGSIR